jgi:predicted transcriptional regulator of viral defense system
VLTTRPIRTKKQTVQGTPFVLKHAREAAMFGTRPVWRGQAKISISSPAKTIIDMLEDPDLGGGIRHVSECLDEFLKEAASPANELITVADQLGNGAVFKRLGFLLEQRGGPQDLITACRERLTTGNAKLDPALTCPRLITRWRLWSPVNWARGGPA